MAIIIGILVAFLVICAILLVLIVLIQDDGADGAGMILGSVASQQYGVRKGNIVTRTTGILATVFMVLSFTLAFLLKGGDDTKSLQKLAEGQSGAESSVTWWEKTTPGADNYLNGNDAADAATPAATASESQGASAETAAPNAAPENSSANAAGTSAGAAQKPAAPAAKPAP